MIRSMIVAAGIAMGIGLLANDASAQGRVVGGFGGGFTTVMPGAYVGSPGWTQVNPWTGSVYRPQFGVVSKPSGNYFYVPGTGSYTPWGRVPGSGVYANPWSGNTYNPGSGFYNQRWWR
jgi:hypothetical protein